MKLSLSVRVAEPPKQKDILAVPFETLAAKAKALGYAGVSMRASVASVNSPPRQVREVRAVLDDLGLAVSMVCGDIPLAANNAAATDAIRNITPYLDLTEALGGRLIRVMMQTEEDIPHARRAADEAAERGLSLVHINHWGTLFETVDESLATLAAIGRENFRVAFEPGNLLACHAGLRPGRPRPAGAALVQCAVPERPPRCRLADRVHEPPARAGPPELRADRRPRRDRHPPADRDPSRGRLHGLVHGASAAVRRPGARRRDRAGGRFPAAQDDRPLTAAAAALTLRRARAPERHCARPGAGAG